MWHPISGVCYLSFYYYCYVIIPIIAARACSASLGLQYSRGVVSCTRTTGPCLHSLGRVSCMAGVPQQVSTMEAGGGQGLLRMPAGMPCKHTLEVKAAASHRSLRVQGRGCAADAACPTSLLGCHQLLVTCQLCMQGALEAAGLQEPSRSSPSGRNEPGGGSLGTPSQPEGANVAVEVGHGLGWRAELALGPCRSTMAHCRARLMAARGNTMPYTKLQAAGRHLLSRSWQGVHALPCGGPGERSVTPEPGQTSTHACQRPCCACPEALAQPASAPQPDCSWLHAQVRIRPPSLYTLWHPSKPAPRINVRASKLAGIEVSRDPSCRVWGSGLRASRRTCLAVCRHGWGCCTSSPRSAHSQRQALPSFPLGQGCPCV